MRSRSWTGCPPASATRARRLAFAPLATLSLLIAGCDDRALPVAPDEDPALLAEGVAPSTVRTPGGDLVTGDAAAFAAALKEIGPDGQVLVWLKETGTPRPSAEFLINLPGSAPETIALATEAPGAKRRNVLGPASVRGASIDAVVRALGRSGVAEVERMEALPLLIVRLSEAKRLGGLNALLRHPNVDYVSAVRARPIRFTAAPVGANPIDVKHTVHRIPEVWNLTRGSGARIGILDSGIARSHATGAVHEDALNLGSHGIIPLGFIDDLCGSPTYGACTPWDDNGHGTLMAGLAGANDNGIGVVGMAPFATTYSMKIAWNTHISGHCDDDIFGNDTFCYEDDDFVRAVNYAAARQFSVLSMSFVGSHNSDVYRALATARNSYGVFLVAGTGNVVGGPAREPAVFDVVMGIAGVDPAGNNLWTTAARDVSGLAGGWATAATCYQNYVCDAGWPGLYSDIGGTSAATANVAGIVALIRSYHPNEGPAQIWERLVNTAVGPNRVVDAYAAITYRRPLAAGISGPSNAEPYSYQTWSASVVNGTAPYSYTWYRDGVAVGTGPTYSASVGDAGFQLRLDVADAAGGFATSTLYVSTFLLPPPNGCGTGQEQFLSPYQQEQLCIQQ